MLTAHRKLDPKHIGRYLPGWEIIDGEMNVVETVRTKAEAEKIINSKGNSMKHNWKLFSKGLVVNGVSGNIYRDRDNQNYWKWRGNVAVTSARKFFVAWLRENNIAPQPKNAEHSWDY